MNLTFLRKIIIPVCFILSANLPLFSKGGGGSVYQPGQLSAVASAGIEGNPLWSFNALYNVASRLGDLVRPGLYGLLGGNVDNPAYATGVLIPLATGGGALYFGQPSVEGVYTIKAGYGKKYASGFALGFYVNYGILSSLPATESYLAVEPAMSYSTRLFRFSPFPIGLFGIDLYLSARNLLLWGKRYDLAMAVAGGSIEFIRVKKDFSGSLNFQADYRSGGRSLPFSASLQTRFRFLVAGVGYRFDQNNPGDEGTLATVGVSIHRNKTRFEFSYGLLYSTMNQMVHSFSLGFIPGYRESKPPLLRVVQSREHFSPDGDGNEDIVRFKIRGREFSDIVGYSFEIRTPNGELVKSFSRDKRAFQKITMLKELIPRFFEKKIYSTIPDEFIWDGSSQALSSTMQFGQDSGEDRFAAEGEYIWSFTAEDEYGNAMEPVTGRVELDITPPRLRASLERSGRCEIDQTDEPLPFSYSVERGDTLALRGRVVDFAGKEVATLGELPFDSRLERSSWNLKGDNNHIISEGFYQIELIAEDRAGNRNRATLPFFCSSMVDQLPAHIVTSAGGFSPNGDKVDDQIAFELVLDNEKLKVADWKFVVTPQKLSLRSQPPFLYQVEMKELGSAEKIVRWDGSLIGGGVAPDGVYYGAMFVVTEDGQKLIHPGVPFVVDNSSPVLRLSSDIHYFSPDNDLFREELWFRIGAGDRSEIVSYSFEIYERFERKGGYSRHLFRRWSAENSGVPEKIYWNGLSKRQSLPESWHSYEAELTVKDRYGNARTKKISLQSSIQVFYKDSYLHIRLSGIEFDKQNSLRGGYGYSVLRRLAKVLNRYQNYRVRIEGHTDSEGSEEENLERSERRAKFIMKFLTQNGVDSSRIGYQGYGEVLTLSKGENRDSAYKNDRIEIVLIP